MPISQTPWKLSIGSIGGPSIQSHDGKFIADVRSQFIRYDTSTKVGEWKIEDAGRDSACNARLIVASPDLLEACRAIDAATGDCGYDCRQGDVMDAIKLVRAAIAKANPSPDSADR